MYAELVQEMKKLKGGDWAQLEKDFAKLGKDWETELRKTYEALGKKDIITRFIKDTKLGDKRFISGPERVLQTVNGNHRPAVVTRYDATKGRTAGISTTTRKCEKDWNLFQNGVSQRGWWDEWLEFVFQKNSPVGKLKPLLKKKYPDVLKSEEGSFSLPLQILHLAVYDAVVYYIALEAADSVDNFNTLKHNVLDALVNNKVDRTLDILKGEKYKDADIVMLQETTPEFVACIKKDKSLSKAFHVLQPKSLAVQSSIILLSQKHFSPDSKELKVGAKNVDLTDFKTVYQKKAGVKDENNDIKMVVASFHGDSKGIKTIPTLKAVMVAMNTASIDKTHKLLFGLDSNTFVKQTMEEKKSKKVIVQAGVDDWVKHFTEAGMTSCWHNDKDFNKEKAIATFNARTCLQPQLNKVVENEHRIPTYEKVNRNPKHFIIFGKDDLTLTENWKDNTGGKSFDDKITFPTKDFPSDHAIIEQSSHPARRKTKLRRTRRAAKRRRRRRPKKSRRRQRSEGEEFKQQNERRTISKIRKEASYIRLREAIIR